MGCNNGFGSCWWIIVLILLFCGCGNNSCGCGNNGYAFSNGCGNNGCGCGCDNGCGCG